MPSPRRLANSGSIGGAIVLFVCALSFAWFAASPAARAQNSVPQPQTPPVAQTNAQDAAQKPAPVTTTVVVHGEVEDNYLPDSVTVGTLGTTPLKDAPLSATVITRDLFNDQVSRLLSDVVKNDASVDDDY